MNTERFWYLLDRIKLHHILFWIGYFIFWVAMYRGTYQNLTNLYFVTAVYLVFNAANFYLVTYWVVPKFYNQRRYLLALLSFLVVLIPTAWGLGMSLIAVMGALGIVYPFSPVVMFMYGIVSNMTSLAVATFLKQLLARLRKDRTEIAIQNKRIEAELQYLKAQVNPHFLFNAINSVYFLIKKDPNRAADTLIKLSDLLRFQLYDCSGDKIAIEQELVYLENYMELEKLRRGERVTVDYMQQGELHGFLIAPLLLIPFLENAFKFVSSHTDRQNLIRVVLRREGDVFQASFFNTYEDLPRAGVGGIGLKNVTRRLELLYPGYTLAVHPERESYSVTLTISLV